MESSKLRASQKQDGDFPIGLIGNNVTSISNNIGGLPSMSTEDLKQLWKVYSTVKKFLPDNTGNRLENVFWRLWTSACFRSPIPGAQVAEFYRSIFQGGDEFSRSDKKDWAVQEGHTQHATAEGTPISSFNYQSSFPGPVHADSWDGADSAIKKDDDSVFSKGDTPESSISPHETPSQESIPISEQTILEGKEFQFKPREPSISSAAGKPISHVRDPHLREVSPGSSASASTYIGESPPAMLRSASSRSARNSNASHATASTDAVLTQPLKKSHSYLSLARNSSSNSSGHRTSSKSRYGSTRTAYRRSPRIFPNASNVGMSDEQLDLSTLDAENEAAELAAKRPTRTPSNPFLGFRYLPDDSDPNSGSSPTMMRKRSSRGSMTPLAALLNLPTEQQPHSDSLPKISLPSNSDSPNLPLGEPSPNMHRESPILGNLPLVEPNFRSTFMKRVQSSRDLLSSEGENTPTPTTYPSSSNLRRGSLKSSSSRVSASISRTHGRSSTHTARTNSNNTSFDESFSNHGIFMTKQLGKEKENEIQEEEEDLSRLTLDRLPSQTIDSDSDDFIDEDSDIEDPGVVAARIQAHQARRNQEMGGHAESHGSTPNAGASQRKSHASRASVDSTGGSTHGSGSGVGLPRTKSQLTMMIDNERRRGRIWKEDKVPMVR